MEVRSEISLIGYLTAVWIFLSAAALPCCVYAKEHSAAERTAPQEQETVIVMDCSKSMEDVDGGYLVPDFAGGLAASMPEYCRIGLIAYNNEVCASLPIGSGSAQIADTLDAIRYRQYGNAGAGMEAAVELFGDNKARKRIILITDGEIMMDTDEGTEESNQMFTQAVATAADKGIVVDVIAVGERIQEGYTAYSAAERTGGALYELADGGECSSLIAKYLFEEWESGGSHVGKLDGTSAELAVSLPDCLMDRAKILLIGEQHNENMTVNCKAGRIEVSKGRRYTVVDIEAPTSGEVRIQMSSDDPMQVDAYLFAEYDFEIETGHSYTEETQTARIWLEIANARGRSLLDGHLQDGGMELYLDGKKTQYTVSEDKIWIEKIYSQSAVAGLEIRFTDPVGNYYGIWEAQEEITVPIAEPEKYDIDWFFWSVVGLFVIAIAVIFGISYSRKKRHHTIRRQVVDMGTAVPAENTLPRNDFSGKIVVYVIHSKNDIDYPPESINLFARCRRDSITLEWILDTCNLPLNLKGAEKIIFKPGEDRSLVVKNSSKASVLIGRALLTRGQSYNLYYHEKVTFIFDQEDAEIEVHYKDLKPNER